MRLVSVCICFIVAMADPSFVFAADDERQFLDGIQARNVGPFRGGRAMVAVGVRQNPHVYYMGHHRRRLENHQCRRNLAANV